MPVYFFKPLGREICIGDTGLKDLNKSDAELTMTMHHEKIGSLAVGGYQLSSKSNIDFFFFNKNSPREFYKLENISHKNSNKIFLATTKSHEGRMDDVGGWINCEASDDKKPIQEVCVGKNNIIVQGDALKKSITYQANENKVYRFATINATIFVAGKKYEPGTDLLAAQLKGAYVLFDKGKEGHVVLCAAPNASEKPNNKRQFSLVKSINYLPKK